MLAGIGMILSCWLPWLDLISGDDPSGWDVYDMARQAGQNSFLIGEFFRSGFSPFFTGLGVAIGGGLIVTAGLVMVFSPTVPPRPGKLIIPDGLAAIAIITAFFGAVPPFTDYFSLTMTNPTPAMLSAAAGLGVMMILGAVGVLAVVAGIGVARTKRRKQG